MNNRSAADVLLEMESKIDSLLSLVKNLDMNVKVLSNKVNELMSNQKKMPTVEAIVGPAFVANRFAPTDPERQVLISAANKLPMDMAPAALRRTSRPDTYSNTTPIQSFNAPSVQPSPKVEEAVIQVPSAAFAEIPSPKEEKVSSFAPTVTLQQKVMDKNGRFIFMADVEIKNAANDIKKTRTNGSGKWMATLPLGDYAITLSKRDPMTKERMEVIQNIKIDGSVSQMDLSPAIMK